MTTAPAASARIAVIALGNVLFGDDAFGPFVLALLHSGWEFPADVVVIDVGTPGLDLVSYLQGREAVILVDAVGASGPAGAVRLYRNDELTRIPAKARVSPHDPAVQETLLLAQFAGDGPRHVLLVGAIPLSLEQGTGLSVPVRDAATTAAAIVVRELGSLGAAPTPRPTPLGVTPWWLQIGVALSSDLGG